MTSIPANTTVYLAPGALVQSSVDRPFVIEGQIAPASTTGSTDFLNNPKRGVKIMGRGTIEANGTVLEPYNLEGFVMEDVTLRNTWNEQWALVPRYQKNALITNVKVLTPRVYARDGIDIDNSSDVLIEKSFVSSADDAICIKAGGDRRGFTHIDQPPVGAFNIAVKNNVVYGGWASLWGYEIDMDVPIQNIIFEGNEIVTMKFDAFFMQQSGRSAITGVQLKNNRLEDFEGGTFFINMYQGQSGSVEMSIENLTVDQNGGICIGYEDSTGCVPVDGGASPATAQITFCNLKVAGRSINSWQDLLNLGGNAAYSRANGANISFTTNCSAPDTTAP